MHIMQTSYTCTTVCTHIHTYASHTQNTHTHIPYISHVQTHVTYKTGIHTTHIRHAPRTFTHIHSTHINESTCTHICKYIHPTYLPCALCTQAHKTLRNAHVHTAHIHTTHAHTDAHNTQGTHVMHFNAFSNLNVS